MTRQDLETRLSDSEDAFTERKPEGANASELRSTIVAFANSVPPARIAVLFLGVADDGSVSGVSNPDTLQKTIRRVCERDCYPPIPYQCEVLPIGGKQVVAVLLEESPRRPHFAGAAYVRRGSESLPASEEAFRELLLTQVDKCREILRHKAAVWTVRSYGRQLEDPRLLSEATESVAECRVEFINPFYVRFRRLDSGGSFTAELATLSLSWDDRQNRPFAILRPIRYAGGA